MMSLTGTPFQAMVAVVAVVAVVATLVLWTRTHGPGWARTIQRLGMLLVCQLLAVALAGTWVNNTYALFASWDDLLGTTPQGRLAMVGPPPQRARFTKASWGMESTFFRGPRSHLASQVYVWLPPQYKQRAYRHMAFPVVMLLHGVPGEPESWMTGGGMPGRFASYVASGALPPAILVIPSVNPGGVDTDCSNTPQSHVATWLAQDVPDLIKHHFRVQTSPQAWALAGLSTGGVCALKLPMQFPNVFGIGAGMSPDPVVGDPTVLANTALRVANSPVYLAKSRPNVRLWAGTGADDLNSLPSNIARLRAAIKSPTTLAPAVVIPGGGHNPNTWAQLEPPMFNWIASVIASPAAITHRR